MRTGCSCSSGVSASVPRVRLVGLLCLALALPAAALAHGGAPVVADAVAGLEHGQIYVDYDATPTLTELEADAIGRKLDQKPGVYVAVLPASVEQELQTNALGVAAELGSRVGRPGLYVASVGGRLAAWSTIDGEVRCPGRGSLAERIASTVDSVLPYYAPEDGKSPWRGRGIAAGVVAAAAVPLLLLGRWQVRRRRAA